MYAWVGACLHVQVNLKEKLCSNPEVTLPMVRRDMGMSS